MQRCDEQRQRHKAPGCKHLGLPSNLLLLDHKVWREKDIGAIIRMAELSQRIRSKSRVLLKEKEESFAVTKAL